MSWIKENSKQKSVHSDKAGRTDVWNKTSAGNTTKEGHVVYRHGRNRIPTDHYGRKKS